MASKSSPPDPSDAIPPRRRRRGGNRRTKAKNIPKLPMNEHGKKAKPVVLEDPPLTLDNVDHYKHSDCRFYDTCLDHAAKSGWEQFSCRSCGVYESNPDIDVKFTEIISRLDREDPI